MTFVNGCKKFKLSSIKGHEKTEAHNAAVKGEQDKALAAGKSLPPKGVVQEMPQNSARSLGLAKMGDEVRSCVEQLMDIAHFIAKNRL